VPVRPLDVVTYTPNTSHGASAYSGDPNIRTSPVTAAQSTAVADAEEEEKKETDEVAERPWRPDHGRLAPTSPSG
jgi:hypothetical protein